MNDIEMIDTDDESLVAYLDGELSREDRDKIENRLVADDSLRKRLQSLQRSWDLLDWLPSPVVDERSVETTLQFVVTDLAQSSSSGVSHDVTKALSGLHEIRRPFGRFWHPTAMLIAIPVVIAAVVFGLVRWNQNRELRHQVADFPVALDMDAYRLSENTDLVDDLMAAPRWSSVVGESITSAVDAMVDPQGSQSLYHRDDRELRTPSPEELAARLREVPAEQRMIALTRWDRFDRLDDSSKASLRSATARLRVSDDASRRLETLRRYVRMREQLSDQMVEQIENSSGQERGRAIDDAVGEMITSIGRVTRRNLSEDAIERIDFTVIQLVKSRLAHTPTDESQPSPFQAYLDEIPERFHHDDDPEWKYRAFALATLVRDPNRHVRSPRDDPLQNQFPPLSHRELETIRSMLPTKDLDTLQQYVSDPWMQSMILRDWAREAVSRKIRGQAKPLSLAEQYERMAAEPRERLDLSPPDEARKILIDGL